MKEKTLTEQWIEFLLDLDNDDFSLFELTASEWEQLPKGRGPIYTSALDIYYAYDIRPFPLLPVYLIKDLVWDYPSGGSDYERQWKFKHKDKYYLLVEIGGT